MWIKVNERKPSSDGKYLARNKQGQERLLLYRQSLDGSYWKAFFSHENVLSNVEEWKDE